jgi:hypothetical protein
MAVGDAPLWSGHILLRVAGELFDATNGSAVEQFSFGLRLGCKTLGGATPADIPLPQNPPDDAKLRTWLTATVVPAVSSLFNTPLLAKECRVTQIGLNAINGGGPTPVYRSNSPVYVYPGQPGDVAAITGKSTTTAMAYHYPPQIACVVSTVTAAQRGYASKGRFYLAAPSADLAADWRLPLTHAQEYASKAATFISALRFTDPPLPGEWRPCIVSPMQTAAGSGPTVRSITGVRVGRVLDTMRSRRTSMIESYETHTLT